jgi:hypothetical protein
LRSFWFWKRSPEPLLGSFLDVQRYLQNPNSRVVSGIFARFSRALEPWAVQNNQKSKKVVECKELQGKLEKHRCKLKSTTIPLPPGGLSRAGACASVLKSLTRPAVGAQATCPPSPAAGGPSSPAPGPSTPRSHRCR